MMAVMIYTCYVCFIHYVFVGQYPIICIEFFRVDLKILWDNGKYYIMYFVVENINNTMIKLFVK